MAAQQQNQATSPSAEVVGNAFVHQYYHILHKSPELVYRFYQESSKLGRPEKQGVMSSITTMQAINEKILSMEYSECKAELKTVDSQESLDGGVLVLVTGYLTGKDNIKRDFTQSFFLARQEKGYFVLNDIFRYMEEADHKLTGQALANGPGAPLSPEQVPSVESPPPQEQRAIEQIEQTPSPPEEEEEANAEEVYNPSENGEGSVVDEEIPVDEVVDEIPTGSQAVVESIIPNTVQEEGPKKSYASIVKVMKENAAPLTVSVPAPPRSVPVNPERQVAPVPTATPSQESSVSSSNATPESNNVQEAADGYSIYIKSLPLNATPAQLEEEFKRFGPIKSGGVQVRSHKQQGFCFGFVEFEVASAVQSAIEASPIMIDGRQAYVEEKRPSSSRGNNSRGRFVPGRGGGFRYDGMRGRVNYGGGRGYGRGDFNNRVDFGNRGGGRGGTSNRGDLGYQRVDNNYSRANHNRPPGAMVDNASSKNDPPRVPAPA